MDRRLGRWYVGLMVGWAASGSSPAQVPENLVVEGVPPIPPALVRAVRPYLEFRTATLQDWHPKHRHLLITTRFADTAQLHLVKQPGGARHQLTFLPEPVAGGWFQPQTGAFIVLMQDSGGGEFYQFYRLELDSGRITLLTDGRSRNTGPRWSRSGRWLAYSSTRRTGRDTDVYVMDPSRPETDRCVCVLSWGWLERVGLDTGRVPAVAPPIHLDQRKPTGTGRRAHWCAPSSQPRLDREGGLGPCAVCSRWPRSVRDHRLGLGVFAVGPTGLGHRPSELAAASG